MEKLIIRHRKFITIVLSILIVLLSLSLLIGRLFDFRWAGGEGYAVNQTVTIDGQKYQRGEIIDSKDSRLHFNFGEAQMWLDKNTQIKLIDSRAGKLEINVIQGRAVLSGPITVSTREVKTKIDGKASFVHYSWLDKIEVASLYGITTLTFQNQSQDISGKAIELSTLPPYSQQTIIFDSAKSSAADFYNWAEAN